MAVNVGGVVICTSVVGGSVAAGCVEAGAGAVAGVVVCTRARWVVDESTLVDVDELAVAGLVEPPVPLPLAISTTSSATTAPPASTVMRRAHRGHPRNAHDPAGTVPGPT